MRFPPLTRSARKVINSDLQNKEKSRERPGVTAARAKREKRFFILTYHNRKKIAGMEWGYRRWRKSQEQFFILT